MRRRSRTTLVVPGRTALRQALYDGRPDAGVEGRGFHAFAGSWTSRLGHGGGFASDQRM
jgi:hypothetical protein